MSGAFCDIFICFGSTCVINREPAFRLQPVDTFDSLKVAMNATSRAGVAPTGDDSDFQQKRREVVANAQSVLSTGTTALVQHKFKVGGSKYVPPLSIFALHLFNNRFFTSRLDLITLNFFGS